MQFQSQSQWVNLCQDVNSNLRNYNGEKAKDKSPTGSSIIKWGLRKSKFFLDFKINLVESLGSRNPIRFLKIYTSEDFDVILVVCVWPYFFSGPWILKWLENQKWSRKLVRVSWQHGYTTLLVWLHGLLCFLFQIDNLIWFDTIQIVRKKNSKLSGLSCVS